MSKEDGKTSWFHMHALITNFKSPVQKIHADNAARSDKTKVLKFKSHIPHFF